MSTNLYKRLKALLPDDHVMTGQVSAVFADGTALEARGHRIARPGACFALRAPQPAQTSTA